MKFQVQSRDLVAALNLVSTVKPMAQAHGYAGYLCLVRGTKCFIYSEDERQKTRVPVPISEVQGEGAFVLPAGHNSAFKYMEGTLEFEPVDEKGANVVNCTRTSGEEEAVYKIGSFDPKALQSFDKDLSDATETATFSVALLKEAIEVTRPYLADPKDTSNTKAFYQSVQLFDATKEAYKSGNGYAVALSGQRACFFYSKDLQDKSFVIHGLRIPLVLAFLAKSEGDIKLFKSSNSTYFVNSAEQVIGWADQTSSHDKFGFYGLSMDRYILRVNRKALEAELRTIRSLIPPEKDKVRIQYEHQRKSLTILANEGATDLKSFPLFVTPVPAEGPDLSSTADVAFNVNADWLLDLVAPMNQEEVELRIAPVRDHADRFLVRTIDNYWIDGRGKISTGESAPEGQQQVHSCRVMRFIPSKH